MILCIQVLYIITNASVLQTLLTSLRLLPPRPLAEECFLLLVRRGEPDSSDNKAIRLFGSTNKVEQSLCYIMFKHKKHLPRKIVPL